MKFIDFFAGIGGFRRGMELAGHECVGFCEWDKFATASYTSMHLITGKQREFLKTLPMRKRQKEILKKEYRNGEWYAEDIREIRAKDVPRSDCWCFGAPCQDFSIAGKRAGLDGDRSSLIREIFRILEEGGKKLDPNGLYTKMLKECCLATRDLTSCQSSLKWNALGMISNGRISTAKITECPKTENGYTLLDVLEEKVDAKYFLSDAAVKRLMNYKDNQLMPLQPETEQAQQWDRTLLKVNSMHKLSK